MENINEKEIQDLKNLIEFYGRMKDTNHFITAYVTDLENKLTELTESEKINESNN